MGKDVIPFAGDTERIPIFPETEAHRELRKGVRRFVDTHIVPYIDEWEEQGCVPRELHTLAANDPSGFYNRSIPKEYGGGGAGNDLMALVISSEELTRCGSTGIGAALLTWSIGLPPIIAHGSDELKRRVVPDVAKGRKLISLCITEPWGGSDVQSLRTTAEDKGDHYIVNGTKTFITTGMRADYFTVAVKTGASGLNGTSLLLAERGMPGLKTTSLKKMGWLCSDTAIVTFDNVKIPKANLIGKQGSGFLYIMKNFNNERLSMSATSVAAAQVCYEDAVSFARQRVTFGKPLIKNQGIRWKLLEVAKEIQATRAMLDACTLSLHNTQLGGKPDPYIIARLSLLKLKATRTFEFAAREACQVLGGKSYLRSGPGVRVERLYREVRVMAIGGGSEEIMLELASRQAKL